MKCRGNQPMMRTFIVRALSFSAVAALTLNPALTPVVAGDHRTAGPVVAIDGQMNARPLSLGIGKSIVIDLPRDIKDVLVADPKIANAVVRSAQRAYIIGAAVARPASYSSIRRPADRGLRHRGHARPQRRTRRAEAIAAQFGHPHRGRRRRRGADRHGGKPDRRAAGQRPGARLAGGADKVVNSIAVRGRDQVMLKVTVAEVARTIIKQMGIDLTANLTYGTAVVNFSNANPFTAYGRPLVATNQAAGTFGGTGSIPSVTATLRAMESAGVVRTLAEPNLTAISGESATFIAGGEFPIPAGYSCDPVTRACSTQISFKKFEHLAQLHSCRADRRPHQPARHTEVSEVSNDNSINARAGDYPHPGQLPGPFPRSRPGAPRRRWRFPRAARWRWRA